MENGWKCFHVISECNELAQNKYNKFWHDKGAPLLHWHWCKTYGFQTNKKYYEKFVEKNNDSIRNDKAKNLWDFSIQTEGKIDHNKPDFTLLVIISSVTG